MLTSKQAQAARIREISGINPRKCMKCGKCTATCPAWDDMDISPHQFVSYVERGETQALTDSVSIWTCMSCFACVERCPRGVEPANIIEAVRLMIIRKQNASRLQSETIPEILDDKMPQQAITSAFRKYSK